MKKLTISLLTATILSTSSLAKMIEIDAQTALNITIYNEDRALVSDTRSANLTQGNNSIAFADVSSQIIAQSALLQGADISLIEQNFNYDLLSENSLLEKAVGSSVLVEYINPVTGEVKTQAAELLAINGANPVLKINGKIETQYPGRIIFNKVPENLWAKPTLIMDIHSPKIQNIPLQLTYLTRGLSWKTDYVANLNADETQMALNGLVTLTNNSSTAYQNASLQLVAGDVNIVKEYIAPRAVYKNAVMATDMALTEGAAVEKVSDFYLYSLPQKTTILPNQTKQVALLSTQNVPVQKTYEFDGTLDMRYTTKLDNIKPNVYLNFENKAENNLGMALPKGIIRLYKKDSSNKLLFVGEDNINHTANLERVRLKMGTAFDITANAKRLSYIKKTNETYEASYEIRLTNGGKKNAVVDIYQNIPNQWKLLSSSSPYTKENSNRIKWQVEIPAEQEVALLYKLEVSK